jgi:hypothetical protein
MPSARTDRRRHAWWPSRGFAHLPRLHASEWARGENTTHVCPSVSQSVAGAAHYADACRQQGRELVQIDSLANCCIARVKYPLRPSTSRCFKRKVRRKIGDLPQCGGAAVESRCRLPPRRNPKGWSAHFSFKCLFIEVLQGYSAPYSATSMYDTFSFKMIHNNNGER